MTTQIQQLETAAGQAGDLLQAAICQIALTGEPNTDTLEALTPEQRVELHDRFDDNGEGTTGWRKLAAEQECERVLAAAAFGRERGLQDAAATLSVSIYRRMDDGRWVWSGDGHMDHGRVTDCAADLGDDVYDALDDEIDGAGTYYVTVDEQQYRADVE